MKIEQLLVQHFYNSREITLQGIGTFKLSPDFVMPKESDKDVEIPENSISFQHNPRAKADEALIDFIVQQTRKMRSLASADLDSYLVLGKQFLNIGKPFKIEGVGILAKNQQGELEFRMGNKFHSRMEPIPTDLKEKVKQTEISFASDIKPPAGNKKVLLIVALLICLGLVGTTIWYFFFKKNNLTHVSVAPALNSDTINKVTVNSDTAALLPVTPTVQNEAYTFRVVFMTTQDSAAAAARMNDLTLRGHHVIMYKKDSVTFSLAEPFKLPLSDSTRVKDSLNSYYFRGSGKIELN